MEQEIGLPCYYYRVIDGLDDSFEFLDSITSTNVVGHVH